MKATKTVEYLTETDPMLQSINRGLLVQYINQHLSSRWKNDVNTSVVFYDDDKMFTAAIAGPITDEQFTKVEDTLWELGVRYWSRGIV